MIYTASYTLQFNNYYIQKSAQRGTASNESIINTRMFKPEKWSPIVRPLFKCVITSLINVVD